MTRAQITILCDDDNVTLILTGDQESEAMEIAEYLAGCLEAAETTH